MNPPPQPTEPATAAGRPGVPGRPRVPGPDDGAAREAIVRFVSSTRALWLAGLWGVAEASLFFVVPDVWLGFVALYAPRRSIATLAAIAVGAVVGAALLYVGTLVAGEQLAGILAGLPGIRPADLGQAGRELAAQGLPAFLNGPLQGLQVKLYVHQAVLQGIALPGVLAFVALNRIERIGIFGLVMLLVGRAGRPIVARWPRGVAAVYAAGWAIFYAWFWFVRPA